MKTPSYIAVARSLKLLCDRICRKSAPRLRTLQTQKPRRRRRAVEVRHDVRNFSYRDSGPVNDERNFHMIHTRFPVPLFASAMIGGEIDDRIVFHPQFFKLSEDNSNATVDVYEGRLIFGGSPSDIVSDMVGFAEIGERVSRFGFELFEEGRENRFRVLDALIVVDGVLIGIRFRPNRMRRRFSRRAFAPSGR